MERLKIPLAAAIHDWGKFAQRTGLWKGDHAEIGATLVDKFASLFPHGWLDDLRDAVGEHHQTRSKKEIVKLIKVADSLSAKERKKEEIPKTEPACTPLISVFSTLEIGLPAPEPLMKYPLNALCLEEKALFPQPEPLVNPEAYEELWYKFEEEVKSLISSGEINSLFRFTSFLALLRKYFTFIPSATPWEEDEEYRTFPDISLFDHLKTSAAIASCLERLWWIDELYSEKTVDKPIAYLLRGDFSGIQDFIYRVTKIKEDAPFHGVARRLRGRSFYISILSSIVVEWLVRQLELTTANILFESGGHFDLLLPVDNKSQEKLRESIHRIEEWFLETFEVELGLVTVGEEVYYNDFENLGRVYEKLETKLAEAKLKKWHNRLGQPDFFTPRKERYHSCQVCQLTPLDESGICKLCQKHYKLGKKLPSTAYLAFIYNETAKKEEHTLFFDSPVNVAVKLLGEEEKEEWLEEKEEQLREFNFPIQAILYRLNSTDFIPSKAPMGLGLSFRFLANTVPVAKEELRLRGRKQGEVTQKGEGLDFEEIAEISRGSKNLGILRADVDHLGFIFSQGISPSISRLSTFSHFMEIFFSGWLKILCQRQFEEWKKSMKNLPSPHPWLEKIDGLFYITYSAGDDLLLIGPWEETLDFAQALNRDFTRYTCNNPNITLSAGISLVRPHYPVQRFVSLAKTALDKAKEEGRNSICFLGKSFKWKDSVVDYETFLAFASKLSKLVEERKVPRGLLHDLGKLHQLYWENQNGERKPLLTPALYYTMVRRLRPELCAEIMDDILDQIKGDSLKPLISYILLATREEGERCL